jgi:hypothetical protein
VLVLELLEVQGLQEERQMELELAVQWQVLALVLLLLVLLVLVLVLELLEVQGLQEERQMEQGKRHHFDQVSPPLTHLPAGIAVGCRNHRQIPSIEQLATWPF